MAAVIGALRAELSASIAKFQEDLGKAAKSVEAFGARANKIGKQLNGFGKAAFRNVTLPVIGLGVAIAKTAGDFEASMNRLEAATSAPAEQLEKMRKLALQVGPDMGVGPDTAAQAFENLAKNGRSAQEILEGAGKATVLLARSAGAELGPAADLASDIMAQFNIQAKDMTGVIDQVNGVLIASKLDFDNYRLALGQVGGVAGGMNIPFAELNAALASTASYFASGSDAGTSFKTFLQRLTPQSKEAQAMIEALGLSFYDAQGQLRPFAEIAEELRTKLAGLTEEARNKALTTIFGSDTIRTAIGLMNQGREGVERFQAAIGDTSAQEQAAAKTKGLNGEMAKFWAQLQSLAITIADSGLIQFLTDAARWLGETVAWLKETNPELLNLGVQIAAVAAVVGPFAIAVGGLAAAFGGLATVIRIAVIPALGLILATPLGWFALAGAAVGALIEYWDDLCEVLEDAWDWLVSIFDASDDTGRAVEGMVAKVVKDAQRAAEIAKGQGLRGSDTDGVGDIKAELPPVKLPVKVDVPPESKTTLEDLEGRIEGLGDKAGGGGSSTADKLKDMADQVAELGRRVEDVSRGDLGGLEGRLRDVDDRFADTRLEIEKQIQELKALGAQGPETASQLAQLEAMLQKLATAHGKATDAAKAQYAAENELRNAQAAVRQAQMSGDINELKRARGDFGTETEAQARLRQASEDLDRERLDAVVQLRELEAARLEAEKLGDQDEAARLTVLVGLAQQYQGILATTTAAQLEDQARQEEAWGRFTDDLSQSLDDMIMNWKFDLKGLFDVFRQLANDLFIKPGTDALAGFMKEGLQSLFSGGFAKGGFISPGEWGIVGEGGAPEVAFGGRHGMTIEPMDRAGGAVAVTQNFYTPNPDAFRASRRQISRQAKEMLGRSS